MAAANTSSNRTHFSNVDVGVSGGSSTLTLNGQAVENLAKDVLELAAATTLTTAQSGSLVALTGTTGYAVTLPAASALAGCNYRFVVQDLFGTTDWVITSPAANMYGTVDELSTVQTVAGATTINLELAADTIGDWIEVVSDGTNWYVSGHCAQAASVTPA
jgi:hypothetical protein